MKGEEEELFYAALLYIRVTIPFTRNRNLNRFCNTMNNGAKDSEFEDISHGWILVVDEYHMCQQWLVKSCAVLCSV